MKDRIMDVLYHLFCLVSCVGVNRLALILLFIHGFVVCVLGVLYPNSTSPFHFPEPLLFHLHLFICLAVTVYYAPVPEPLVENEI